VDGIVTPQASALRFASDCVELAQGLSLRRSAVVSMLLLCFAAGQASRTAAASPPRPDSRALTSAMTWQFAIGDFDGDQQADLATVQSGGGSSSHSRYWIRFELTSGNRQLFGITGPAGGLQISPRDVNGDQALDLVISTAWQNQTIAILLNDGHGNFTLADPEAFPNVTPDSQTEWSGKTAQIHDYAAIPPSRSSAKACRACDHAFLVRDHSELRPPRGFRFHIPHPEFACASRAPPLDVHHV
jgi:hypothetical protein